MRLWRMRVSRFQYRNRFRSALKEHSRIFQDRKVFSSSVTTIRTETRLCNAAHSCAVAEAAWWGTIKMIQEITSVRITDVWAALGGGPLRQRRGQAFWRDGDGYNVSLNDDKGCWHDFRYGKVAAFSILSRQ